MVFIKWHFIKSGAKLLLFFDICKFFQAKIMEKIIFVYLCIAFLFRRGGSGHEAICRQRIRGGW